MRSEVQYFMSQQDHASFDEFILSNDGVSIEPGKHFDEIHLLDGSIQYERSLLENGVLTAGRISIATTDLNGNYNFTSHKQIEALYKKLRNRLKKHCVNNLVCFNEKSDVDTTQKVNNFWLCSGAEIMMKNEGIKLKQFQSGNVVFKLAQSPNKASHPTPKSGAAEL